MLEYSYKNTPQKSQDYPLKNPFHPPMTKLNLNLNSKKIHLNFIFGIISCIAVSCNYVNICFIKHNI